MAFETSDMRQSAKQERPIHARHGVKGPDLGFRGSPFGNAPVLFTRLCFVIVAVVVVSGCSNYKQELEGAKQQIDRLAEENGEMKEKLESLEKEQAKLNDERKIITEKIQVLREQISALEKAKASLTNELDEAKKNSAKSLSEIKTLKQEKEDLQSEVEKLKKTAAPSPSMSGESGSQSAEIPSMQEPVQSASKPAKAKSPCDALIHYMKKCQRVIQKYKGEERTRMLDQVKQEFAPLTKEAPEKALKAAEKWVSEVVRIWDDPRDDSAFILLSNKDVVLKSCNMTPEEAGF